MIVGLEGCSHAGELQTESITIRNGIVSFVRSQPTVETDPRIQRSRAKVLAAATELLLELGPRGVTVDAVAERSGVAKSTLYRHWDSATDLLIDAMRSNVPDEVELDLTRGFEHALRALMHGAATSLSSPQLVRVLPALVSLRLQLPEVADLMRADLEERTNQCNEILKLGVKEGHLRTGLDPHRVMQVLIGPLFFAVLTEKGEGLHALADEVVGEFLASHARSHPKP